MRSNGVVFPIVDRAGTSFLYLLCAKEFFRFLFGVFRAVFSSTARVAFSLWFFFLVPSSRFGFAIAAVRG